MAEFGATETQISPVQNYVSPEDGVVKASPLSPLAEAFGGITATLQAGREGKTNKLISGLMKQDVRIADAYAQGRMTQVQAHNKMRQNLLDLMETTDDPTTILTFVEARNKLLGITGGAKIVDKGTEADQQTQRLNNELVNSGLIRPDEVQNVEKVSQAQTIYAKSQAAQFQWNHENAAIENELKNINLTSARRGELEERKKTAALTALRGIGPSEVQTTSQELEAIASNPNLSESERVEQITMYMAQRKQQAHSVFGPAGKENVETYIGFLDPLEQHYLQKAKGELGDEELKRKIDRSLKLAQDAFLADPTNLRIAALEPIINLSQNAQLQLQMQGTFNGVIDFIAKGAESDPANLYKLPRDQQGSFQDYFNMMLEGAKADDEALVQNAYDHMNNALGGLEEYEGTLRKDAKTGILPTKMMARQEFLTMVQKNPDALTNLEGAKEAIGEYYNKEVWGMVDREFRKLDTKIYAPGIVGTVGAVANALGADVVEPINQADSGDISIEWGKTGMRFSAKDPKNKLHVQEARRLQKELAPVIETTIKATAHMSGSNDYKSVWESVAPDLLGGTGSPEDLDGGDGDDRLDMEDFSFPRVSSAGLPEDVKADTEFLGEVDRLAAKYDVPAAHLLAVMDFETGGTFNPSQKNAAGSSATGLIQFMGQTAKDLGTTTQALSGMTRKEQMQYVEKYFDQFGDAIVGSGPKDLYMAVLFPKAINKGGDYVLFRKGTKTYAQNKGLDRNGDGTVTKAEAAARVVSLVGKHQGESK